MSLPELAEIDAVIADMDDREDARFLAIAERLDNLTAIIGGR